MREKMISDNIVSEVQYEENKLLSFQKINSKTVSYRVYENGMVGIHCHIGEITDEEGFLKAEENLRERPRPYPFELESGKRSRNLTEREVADKELLEIADDCMKYICGKYPDFVFKTSFSQNKNTQSRVNDKGMDYSNTDCCVNVSISFKHVSSKDIMDGFFNFSLRDFEMDVFTKMADNYLANYTTEVELPEEIIMDMQYYGLVGKLADSLNGENLALGTSLLSGKVGEKVFADGFTLTDDVTDEESWFNCFWDGDGCVLENDKQTFIENGVVLTGYADKKNAQKYGISHTGDAYFNFSDIPGAGVRNLRIGRSTKTVKELLNGRYCVVPLNYGGGGFADNGDYTMPVHSAMLCDGEKILGKLPPFTIVSNMFDMFGKDFIGVGADKPIYNDKQILFRVKKGNIL